MASFFYGFAACRADNFGPIPRPKINLNRYRMRPLVRFNVDIQSPFRLQVIQCLSITQKSTQKNELAL